MGQLAIKTGGDIIYVPNYAFQPDGDMGYVSFSMRDLCGLFLSFFIFLQITLVRRNKLKAIDQEPLKEVDENELRNDTETLNAGNKEDQLESQE